MTTVRSLKIALLLAPLAAGCIAKSNFPKRAVKIFCDKLKECQPDNYDQLEMLGGCKENVESSTEDTLDDCDKYKGGKAYQCLQKVKTMSCEDFNAGNDPQPCQDFDDACGFDDNQPVAEYENGLVVHGLMDLEIVPAD